MRKGPSLSYPARSWRKAALLAAGACGLLAARASAWTDLIRGTEKGAGAATADVLAERGNIVCAGFTAGRGTGSDFTVVKVSGRSGKTLWRQVLSGPGATDQANAVAVDGAGNVLAAGVTSSGAAERQLTVVKLSGTDGARLWRRDVADGDSAGFGIAVDAGGDAVVAGFTTDATAGKTFVVMKLAGASGMALWRTAINGPGGDAPDSDLDTARALTVDGAGDVVAAGYLSSAAMATQTFVVVKLSGSTGIERWRSEYSSRGFGAGEARVAVGASGDVVAAGEEYPFLGPTGFVTSLSGVDGASSWFRSLGASPRFALRGSGEVITLDSGYPYGTIKIPSFNVASLARADGAPVWERRSMFFAAGSGVAVDPAGDVMSIGIAVPTGPGNPPGGLIAAKLAGGDGATVWQRSYRRAGVLRRIVARSIEADAAGNIVLAGAAVDRAGSSTTFGVAKLSGKTGRSSRRVGER